MDHKPHFCKLMEVGSNWVSRDAVCKDALKNHLSGFEGCCEPGFFFFFFFEILPPSQHLRTENLQLATLSNEVQMDFVRNFTYSREWSI